jgi:hypothetical protein
MRLHLRCKRETACLGPGEAGWRLGEGAEGDGHECSPLVVRRARPCDVSVLGDRKGPSTPRAKPSGRSAAEDLGGREFAAQRPRGGRLVRPGKFLPCSGWRRHLRNPAISETCREGTSRQAWVRTIRFCTGSPLGGAGEDTTALHVRGAAEKRHNQPAGASRAVGPWFREIAELRLASTICLAIHHRHRCSRQARPPRPRSSA